MYIVPAFSGLFAPYWQSSARGVIVGMVVDDLLMQFQADILGRDVIRPLVKETTALGAAYAAALAVGFYKDLAELKEQWRIDRTWKPCMDAQTRETLFAEWKKALSRSLNWID